MKEFYELTARGRALRLRRMALVALERYDLDVKRVRLMTNSTNGIFRVDTPDEKYVLRITDPLSCLSLEEIRSEMTWLAALGRDTDLGVPTPLTTRQGTLVTTVEVAGVPEARHCAVFNWVPGRNLSERLTPENVYRLGGLAAQLHEHAATFTPPEGFRVRKRDNVFPFANPDFSYVEPIVLFDEAYREHFPPGRRALYEKAVGRVQKAVDELCADQEGLRVIHNDLHQWNVKVHRGRVYALDFENLMWGYPVQDVATTLFYIQWQRRRDELVEAYRQGYTSRGAWPEQYAGQIDAFIGGHGMMLINYLLICDTPEDQRLASDYIARVESHLAKVL
jgi:Ser/Thr protein kinase RdoA (MazF antagonist)